MHKTAGTGHTVKLSEKTANVTPIPRPISELERDSELHFTTSLPPNYQFEKKGHTMLVEMKVLRPVNIWPQRQEEIFST